jgi:hypothetical protein
MPLVQEATMGFEPMIRVLQTLALPLGHVAEKKMSAFSAQPSARTPGRTGLLIADG